jgi:ribonuclease BN (tRNA processing enzyme)
VRLTVVGCAGSFPGPDSAASCYLIQAADAGGRTWNVVLDLGSGALGPLQRACDPADLDAVALTHLHPDHCADVSGLYVYLRYGPANRDAEVTPDPIPLFGPVGTTERLGEMYGLEPGETMAAHLTVGTWEAGSAVQVGPMTLTPVPVEHPVPAFGFRIEGPAEFDPDRTVTLAYTGDTDLCPQLADLADDADVLLAEAAFVEGRDDAVRGIHLTGRRAGQVAAAGGVGRLVLTHVPAWNDPEVARIEAGGQYDGPVELARAGLVVVL